MPSATFTARRLLSAVAAALAFATPPAAAQLPLAADPAQAWRTMSTEHFRVHYRAEQAAWARHVTERLEGIRLAVGREIGYLPPKVTDVVIDDPLNQPNGSAVPFMDGPVMFFWPTPPDPGSGLSQQTTWGELLSIHEFAHIAHLARPSREPWEKAEQLLPFLPHIGPIPRRVPTWVSEGYATLVEGRLSASGRPNSVWRAAVLRSWALEGLLPAYEAIDDGATFVGGSMPYLVGSAYLEWLARQRGDSSLPQLWRRLTARVPRDFGEAFTGSFGDPPQALYGRFLAEVSTRALTARDARTAVGLVEGERVARFEHGAGAPTLSPDGSRVALVLGAEGGRPARIEIWNTAPGPADSIAIRDRLRMLEDDPEDVADFSPYPRRPRAVSTLWPARGRAHMEPRFLPDGRRLLVTRMEPLLSGALRPDLFIWDPRLNEVKRVTKGAGIRLADPTPDGERAVGIRCGGGTCDLVEITLASGAVRVIAAGTTTRIFAGARSSSDGQSIATAVHENGRWQVAVVARASGQVRVIDVGDGASRYAPAWMPDARSLVVVSEAGGVADLETLTLDGVATPITRVLTATHFPEVSRTNGTVWFLSLHARGWDVRRLANGGAPLARLADLRVSAAVSGARVEPVLTNPPAPAASTPEWPVGPVQDTTYAFGPRGWRLLPVFTLASTGSSVGFALTLVDPVGRLGVLAQGIVGERSAWRGASVAATWRGERPRTEFAAYWAREEPSQGGIATGALGTLDLEHAGVAVTVSLDRTSTLGGHRYSGGFLGGSAAPIVSGNVQKRATRMLGWFETAHHYQWVRSGSAVLGLEGQGQLARGVTDGVGWVRVVGAALLRVGGRRTQFELGGIYGKVTGDAPLTERLQIGGPTTTMLPSAALSQRIEDVALAAGTLTGTQAARVRAAIVRGPLSVFWEGVAAGSQVHRAKDWWRVSGLEVRMPIDAAPIIRLSALEIRAGGAYAFDDDRTSGWRGWLVLSARP